MIRAAAFAFCLASTATPSSAADFEFCWIGANGYRMEGRMTVQGDAMAKPFISHRDVTAFFIQGFQNDVPLGSWDLSQLTSATSWNLSFDTRALVFPTGGMHNTPTGQAWNAGGRANNCGDPGFGFNSGTNAQDLCVNNVWRTDSMISRYTLFPAYPAGTNGKDCGGAPLLGRFEQDRQQQPIQTAQN